MMIMQMIILISLISMMILMMMSVMIMVIGRMKILMVVVGWGWSCKIQMSGPSMLHSGPDFSFPWYNFQHPGPQGLTFDVRLPHSTPGAQLPTTSAQRLTPGLQLSTRWA
jgi:hypothetical protein